MGWTNRASQSSSGGLLAQNPGLSGAAPLQQHESLMSNISHIIRIQFTGEKGKQYNFRFHITHFMCRTICCVLRH